MATVTVASSNPSFSHTFFTLDDSLPGPGPGRPREASFSSYLSAADESYSLRLSGEFTDHRNTATVQVTLGSGRKKAAPAAAQDDELDVFGAERYFSGGMDGDEVEIKSEKTWTASPLKEPEPIGRTRTRPGTPSTCSEASGNSRSLLMRDSRRDRSRNNVPRPHPGSKKFLGIFPCSCSDGSSVEVDRSSKESDGGGFPASRRVGPKQLARPELWCNEETLWRRADRAGGGGGGFATKREDYSFPPVLNPAVVGNSTVGTKVLQEEQKLARVEVLGAAPFSGKANIASSLRRSLAIISPFASGTAVSGGATRVDDDACSEASSDLFEIESFSTSTFPLGGAGGTSASTTCYEPSEASIEWSVVTASAANFSVASDGEVSPPKGRRADGRQHHQQRTGGGLLLGCGSARAVNVVAPSAHRVQEAKAAQHQQRQRLKPMDSDVPEIRYHAESPRSVDFEHGRVAHVLAARGIPRPAVPPPHSPRLQLSL